MFPIRWNEIFRKKDGTLGTMEDLGGGGGGGSFTPDYENEVLNMGTVDNWSYYIPMEKRYIGPGVHGYEVETKSTSGSDASLDIYDIIVNNGSIVTRELIQNLSYKTIGGYNDDNISIIYTGSNWTLTLKRSYVDLEGSPVSSPITWSYDEIKDVILVPSE